MDCKNIKELLTQYSLGNLQDLDEKELQTHMDNCIECRDYVSESKSLWSLLETRDELEPNPEFLANFWDKVSKDEVKVQPGFLKRFTEIKLNWTLTGAMASIFLVSIITFGIFSPDTRNSLFMSADEQDELMLIELDNAISTETAEVLAIYGPWDGSTDVNGGSN